MNGGGACLKSYRNDRKMKKFLTSKIFQILENIFGFCLVLSIFKILVN